jgi:hypothetical protein
MSSRLLMKAESCVNEALFVIEDEAHGRILSRLKSGERYVKSFVLGRCPHKVGQCACPFALNFLDEDGKMVRTANGKIKPVYSISELVSESTCIKGIQCFDSNHYDKNT